jgi:RNA polymerase sigma factor, sigma-70 family
MEETILENTLSLLALSSTSIDKYLYHVLRLPNLSEDEEYALAKKYQDNGDLNSAHKLVLSHLKLAASMAKELFFFNVPKADLIQEANIGLMKAVKAFDPENGARLATYASFWIKESLFNFIYNNIRMVKAATTKPMRKVFGNLKRLLGGDRLTEEKVSEIAETLGVSKEDVRSIGAHLQNADGTYNTVFVAEDENVGAELTHHYENDNPEFIFIEDKTASMKNKALQDAISMLPEKAQMLIKNRFLCETPLTYKDIGQIQGGVSPQAVQQQEYKILKHLREKLSVFDNNNLNYI